MLNITIANDENGPPLAAGAGNKPAGSKKPAGASRKGLGGGLGGKGGDGSKASAEAKPRRALGDISNRGKDFQAASQKTKPVPVKAVAASSKMDTAASKKNELPPIERFFPNEQEPPLPCFDRSGIFPQECVDAVCLAQSCCGVTGARTPALDPALLSPSATPSSRAKLVRVQQTPKMPKTLADALDEANCWSESEQLEAALAISWSDFAGALAAERSGDLMCEFGPEASLDLGPLNFSLDKALSSTEVEVDRVHDRVTVEPPFEAEADTILLPESPLMKIDGDLRTSSAPMAIRPPASTMARREGTMASMKVFRHEDLLSDGEYSDA